ncbi:MAG TPA: sulfatase-like hydrolase/transferase [Kofleriaceae bacterium]|nr:sulfatase-like hydrolase/transferase [Kofleriaceae bacterium]
MSRGGPTPKVDGETDSGTRALGRRLSAALVAGAVAGAAAGVIDGLWSWRGLGQFAPGAGDRLRALLFLGASSGLAGALAALLLAAAAIALARATRLGDVADAIARRAGIAALSLALACVPAVAGSLALFYWIALHQLQGRKHVGLIIAAAMGLGLAALLVAALASFVLARPIELGLARLARRPGWRVLSSPRAPLAAVLVLLAAAAAAGLLATWSTLSLLPLRPLWVALLAAALFRPALSIGHRLAGRLAGLRPLARRAALAAATIALLAIALWAGAAEAPREAAIARSGWGGTLARALSRLGDLDRDGFSRFLGGGDCDDGERAVHPGAAEVPDDGLDNNCIGGDATLRPAPPARFAQVPASIPADFNVLFLTVDTLRADHVGAYGYDRATTPRLDRVAAEGALFENAWAHAPSTRYSIPAILTGRYPLEVSYADIPNQWPGLSEDNTTIAEVLKQRGFATAAVLNYWYFEKRRGMDQGFDHYDNQNQRLHKGIPGEGPARTRGSSSREQTDKAVAMLDQLAGRRFFLWVHYYDPHFDYERHTDVPSFGTRRVDLYDHEIRHTDQHIGRLLDELARRGLDRRTAVVVTGDHGEGFGEHGIDLHGYHLYAPQTRVPLIVRVPGLRPRRVAMPVGHVDILPTLANLAGAAPVPGTSGVSLVDVMAGAPDRDRIVFQQLSYEGNNEMRAAASRRCHVIYNVSPHSSWEVYRIDRDPGETRDLSGERAECDGERQALAAWYDQSEMPAGAAGALLPGRPEVARPLDVDLGDEVRLLAVDLPQHVAPGDSFPVTYTFEARAPLAGGWKVFAHFEGGGGARFQGDHEPPRPLAWWRAGQFIRYTRQVAVPAGARPGRYRLWVGLFRRAERRPAASRRVEVVEDRAQVGAIEVRR